MAKVIISHTLERNIGKKFKQESVVILQRMQSLQEYPHKGKAITSFAGVVIKELKYKKFRFYSLTDGNVLKFGTEDELATLIIKFVAMSEKKDQQATINNLKHLLQTWGFEQF